MFNIFKKVKTAIEPNKVTLQKYKPYFVTVDGVRHEGLNYCWCIAERLRCSIPEYIMVDLRSDGYIEDQDLLMHPLSNVISIEWKLIDEKTVEDRFSQYQIFVTTKELEKVLNK